MAGAADNLSVGLQTRPAPQEGSQKAAQVCSMDFCKPKAQLSLAQSFCAFQMDNLRIWNLTLPYVDEDVKYFLRKWMNAVAAHVNGFVEFQGKCKNTEAF